jgi:hypothetical protein
MIERHFHPENYKKIDPTGKSHRADFVIEGQFVQMEVNAKL